MSTACLVTGTDTGVGKTEVSCGLLHALAARGLRVAGMKPVASGCVAGAEGLRNDDALALQAATSSTVPYEWINPYAYAPPIAPHLAAAEAGQTVDPARIAAAYRRLAAHSDYVVVEGVGGWAVPLNDDIDVAGLAACLQLPVVLVVGLRLGCLNHALLTAAAIDAAGAHCIGWVGNQIDPQMGHVEGNLATLHARLAAPCLGIVPWLGEAPEAPSIAARLDVAPLLARR